MHHFKLLCDNCDEVSFRTGRELEVQRNRFCTRRANKGLGAHCGGKLLDLATLAGMLSGSSQSIERFQKLARDGRSGRDWLFNECLANNWLYSKPDSQKPLLIWEVKTAHAKVSAAPNLRNDHPWLHDMFLCADYKDGWANKGGGWVRLPFNPWDATLGSSIGPGFVDDQAVEYGNWFSISRWSTASRSNVALVPKTLPHAAPLMRGTKFDSKAIEAFSMSPRRSHEGVHLAEWNQGADGRFMDVVGGKIGTFCGSAGGKPRRSLVPHRLYSIKTGVDWVGSKSEASAGKNVLEANSELAMSRSDAVRKIERARAKDDSTFRIQAELLTITVPALIGDGGFDGFQVRDLTCLHDGEDYLPGHAVPYTESAFSFKQPREKDVAFWVDNFAVPCGRAKARMFLEFGMIHSSANAQNFILAFPRDGAGNGIVSFILRDIGDTYWHDDYIAHVLGTTSPAGRACVHEASTSHPHLLHRTSSSSYPAPHMVRVVAWSVMTHGFAEMLRDKRGWQTTDVLRFAQGLLDGFRNYTAEATNWSWTKPTPASKSDTNLYLAAVKGKYQFPRSNYKESEVTSFLMTYAGKYQALAAGVRAVSNATPSPTLEQIEQWIDAEEVALCASIEAQLRAHRLTCDERKLPDVLGKLR
jgi:hypothetical protein